MWRRSVGMQSTTVVVGGKGTNPKTTLYVGGLEESVNEAILHSAFIPFGDIKDVNIPMDHATGKHRGFGFVEFESKEVQSPHFYRAWHGKKDFFWAQQLGVCGCA